MDFTLGSTAAQSVVQAEPLRRSLAVLWIRLAPQSLIPSASETRHHKGVAIDLVDSYRAACIRLSSTLYDAIIVQAEVSDSDVRHQLGAGGSQAPIVVLAPPAGSDSASADRLFMEEATPPHPGVGPASLPPHLQTMEGMAITVRLLDVMHVPPGSARVFYAAAATLRAIMVPPEHPSLLTERAGAVFTQHVRRVREPRRTPLPQALLHIENTVRQGTRPTAQWVAHAVGIDAAYLGRRLQEESGLTFCAWRNLFTMWIAVRRLAETMMRVSEIGYGLGFQQPSHFAREFRAIMGMSAGAYRHLWSAVHAERHRPSTKDT